jgi:hypothetical protein
MSNWMRDLKRVYSYVTSPTMVATAGNYMHIEVPGIPNEGVVLKRLRIIGTGITTTASNYLDIKVLRDSAKYREQEALAAGAGEPYVVFAWNDQVAPAGPNTLWLSDVTFSDDVEYWDDLESNTLHLRIEAPNSLTGPVTFRVDVWADGLQRLREQTRCPGTHPFQTQPQILRWSVGNVWTDLSYLHNPKFEPIAKPMFTATSDYVYFGFSDPFTGLWFMFDTVNNESGITCSWEYWDGTSWGGFTVRDNCVSKNAISDVVFRYSGVVDWEAMTDWVATDLATAVGGTPPYDYSESVISESFPTSPAEQGGYTPKYWIRMNMSDIDTQPLVKWIRKRDDRWSAHTEPTVATPPLP